MVRRIARDPDLQRPSVFCRDHRNLHSVVHHLPAELSRSCRDDGGAGDRRVPHDNHALGAALRSRVRATLVAVRTIPGIVLAHGRDGSVGPRRAALPVSGGGSIWKARCVVALQ